MWDWVVGVWNAVVPVVFDVVCKVAGYTKDLTTLGGGA